MSIFSKDSTVLWYRTRLFWGVVIGALILWGVGYYFFEVYQHDFSLYRTLVGISLSLGALSIGFFLFEIIGEILSVVIYYSVMTALLFMTFRNKKVCIVWPILFTTIFLIGHILGVFFLGYFG